MTALRLPRPPTVQGAPTEESSAPTPNSAPTTCTTPNYLGTINLYSGAVNPVNLGMEMVQPVGLTFLGASGG